MKKIIFTLSLVIVTFYAHSQCKIGDCKNGFSTMKYSDATYEGNYTDGKFDNLGLMFYNDKRIYHGEFKNNNFNGHGYYKWENGASHFGSWKNGLQSGLGIEKNASGTIINAGEYIEGKLPNPLNSTAPKNNPKNCTGNCVDGVGKFVGIDSVNYLGVFKDKNIVFGTIQRKEYVYDGEIKNNVPHGYGQIKYLDDNEYFLGYFKDGQKHGTGIFTDKNNKRIFGKWNEGEYQDPSKFIVNEKDFCDELISLAKLSKKEREGQKIIKENYVVTTLEKQFLKTFKIDYENNLNSSDKIFIRFPSSTENKPTLNSKEIVGFFGKCKKFTSTRESYFMYKDVEFYTSKYSTSISIKYPKPDPCISGNCKNGKGKKQFDKGVYEGEFVNGERSGQGKYTWDNGNIFEGEYKNDKRNGKGVIIWKVGDKYEGDFVDSFRTGKGKYTWASGNYYEGGFVKNKNEGFGTYIWKNGDTYTGTYKNNKRTGQGTFTTTDGSKYIGVFKDNKYHGFGKSYDKEGKNIYEGDFKNNLFEGQGTLYYTNGKHIGEFKNGKREGLGKFYNESGNLQYDGNYKNDKSHGKGIFYYKSGKKGYEGNFENNKRNGQGIKYYTDGRYVGQFKDDKRHGLGKFYNLEGKLTYQGQYKDDKPVK